MERFGGINSLKSVQKRENTMRKVCAFGVKLKPLKLMMKLLNNDCQLADYYLYRNIVAVVANDTILTVYKYNPDNWERLKKED